MNYGINKEANPLKDMRFYSKYNPTAVFEIRREEISVTLPDCFSERLLYAYAKRSVPLERDLAARCFRLWCKSPDNSYEVDEAREGYVQLLTTPIKASTNCSNSVSAATACTSAKKQKLDFAE